MEKGGFFKLSIVTNKFNFTLWLAIIGICVFVIYMYLIDFMSPTLLVTALDIGQGDSILIKTPLGQTILIDGSLSPKKLNEKLSNELSPLTTKIDYVIISHHDKDHIGGLLGISNKYHIKHIIDPEISFSKQPKNTKWLAEMQKVNPNILYPKSNKDIEIEPGLYLDFLYPINNWDNPKLVNESLVFILHFGENSFYFGGDSEEPQENIIIHSGQNIQADHYKVSHHGSKSSSSIQLLNQMKAKSAFLSYGFHNQYKHPHPSIIERLNSYNIPYFSTGGTGNIIYKCSFTLCSVFKENRNSL